MGKKGLCRTCVNDEGCTYPRSLPVWLCEEFSGINPRPVKLKNAKREITQKRDKT